MSIYFYPFGYVAIIILQIKKPFSNIEYIQHVRGTRGISSSARARNSAIFEKAQCGIFTESAAHGKGNQMPNDWFDDGDLVDLLMPQPKWKTIGIIILIVILLCILAIWLA